MQYQTETFPSYSKVSEIKSDFFNNKITEYKAGLSLRALGSNGNKSLDTVKGWEYEFRYYDPEWLPMDVQGVNYGC